MAKRRPLYILFALIFLAEVGWGYYAAHLNDYMHGDAISRVANAFYVLFSRDPHLGAMGFVWNPLPSMLELIPLLLWKLWPAVAGSGLAAVVVSAAFAAGTATLLYAHARAVGMPMALRLALTLGFACNPFVFLYGANGMSEMMFAFFVVWAVISLTEWMREPRTGPLIMLGLALALGFWTRYEAVAFGAAVAFGIVAILLARTNEPRIGPRFGKSDHMLSRIESILFTVLTPAVFSGLLWIWLNYTIMGDPLFFLRSGYSNTAFVQDRSEELVRMTGDLWNTLAFVLRKSLYFSLPLLALLLTRLLTGRWRRADMLVLLALAASIPAMQFAMLYVGSSYGWLRFFVYAMFVAAAWLPYEWTQLRRRDSPALVMSALCAALLLSSLVVRDMNDQRFAPEEYGSLHMGGSGTAQEMRDSREMARYLDGLIESGGDDPPLILTDSFSAFSVIVNIRNPQQLVITNDRDFNDALRDPAAHGVDYMLVKRSESAVLQIIDERYPGLFDGGYDWTEPVEEFGDSWRLFRVVGSPAAKKPAASD